MANQPFRIVHFSDIHVGTAPRSLGAFFDKRFLGSLNYLLRRRREVVLARLARAAAEIGRLAPDVVICTGDLTSTGTPEEFNEARDILKPIRRQCPGLFFYVPGNHDCYVRDPGCRTALRETFSALNDERFELEDLPVRRRIGAATFFLLNAAHPTSPFRCSGTLEPAARERLDAWFDESRAAGGPRILVNHFPLRAENGEPLAARRRLRGGEWLNRALEAGRVDVALCGHVHTPYIRRPPTGGLEVCAGSLTIAGKLNVVDYSFETEQFSQFWVDVTGERVEPARTEIGPAAAIVERITPATAGPAA